MNNHKLKIAIPT